MTARPDRADGSDLGGPFEPLLPFEPVSPDGGGAVSISGAPASPAMLASAGAANHRSARADVPRTETDGADSAGAKAERAATSTGQTEAPAPDIPPTAEATSVPRARRRATPPGGRLPLLGTQNPSSS